MLTHLQNHLHDAKLQLQRNLPQMLVLLMEPYAMIQVSILLQPHRTVVANFISGKFGLFRRNPGWKTLV